MYLCLCKGIRECDLRCAVRDRCPAPQHLITTFGLDDEDCCGRCAKNIEEWVALARTELE
jgi:bacterioferritin-associated ferredoxin